LVAFLNWTAMSIKEKFPLIIDEWKFLIILSLRKVYKHSRKTKP